MTSFVATNAIHSAFGDVHKDWSTVGGGSGPNSTAAGEQTINWINFNYPPLLRIVHYDPAELPTPVARIVRLIHLGFILTIVTVILTFINSIVLAAGGIGFWRVVYSCLNILLIGSFSGYTFYEGYCGMALSETRKLTKYALLQAFLCILSLIFGILRFGAFNGFVSFIYIDKEAYKDVSSDIKSYWKFAIISESSLWFLIAVVGAWNILKTKSFNPYHSQQERSSRTVT